MGLPGRSGIAEVGIANKEVVEELAIGGVFRISRGMLLVLTTPTEDVEPFIVASLRRKSSKGAPILSPIGTLWRRDGLRMGVLEEGEVTDCRDDIGGSRDDREFRSVFLAFRKTV